MLSLGVPMIVMGDEVRRSQHGNNNAYCLDNETSWFDWTLLSKHADVHRFTKLLMARRLLRDVEHERQRIELKRVDPELETRLARRETGAAGLEPQLAQCGIRRGTAPRRTATSSDFQRVLGTARFRAAAIERARGHLAPMDRYRAGPAAMKSSNGKRRRRFPAPRTRPARAL